MVRRLRIQSFVEPGNEFHISRADYGRTSVCGLHTHDFPEVFWVERGAGTHLINGSRQLLEPGLLVLMRARDTHDLRGRTPDGFTLVNIAFPAATLEAIRRRYFTRRPWPWRGDTMPASFHLSRDRIRQLSGLADSLFGAEADRLALDSFLLTLLRTIHAPVTHHDQPVLPNWLDDALARFTQPEHFAGGPAALAQLANRCPEHVNRVVRQHLNKTATELVNDLRMAWASKQLRMTSRPIVEIAMDCGIENLGYFYELFRKHWGTTPRKHRIESAAPLRSR